MMFLSRLANLAWEWFS